MEVIKENWFYDEHFSQHVTAHYTLAWVPMWQHRGLAVKNKEMMVQKAREKTGPSLRGGATSLLLFTSCLLLNSQCLIITHSRRSSLFPATPAAHTTAWGIYSCAPVLTSLMKQGRPRIIWLDIFNYLIENHLDFPNSISSKKKKINPDGEQYKPQSKRFSDLHWWNKDSLEYINIYIWIYLWPRKNMSITNFNFKYI